MTTREQGYGSTPIRTKNMYVPMRARRPWPPGYVLREPVVCALLAEMLQVTTARLVVELVETVALTVTLRRPRLRDEAVVPFSARAIIDCASSSNPMRSFGP